jgi:hypothetical protein
MSTLFLSAPRGKSAASTLHRTFNTILQSGVGPDYAIASKWILQISPGMKVVVFDRDDRRRAEGRLNSVATSGEKTGQGILRYHVHIRDLHTVPYADPPKVDRLGVMVS